MDVDSYGCYDEGIVDLCVGEIGGELSVDSGGKDFIGDLIKFERCDSLNNNIFDFPFLW